MLKKILDKLKTNKLHAIANYIAVVADAVKSVFIYLKAKQLNKIDKYANKLKKQREKQIDDIADNGTLKDLLNFKQLTFAAILLLTMIGCKSIDIVTTSTYEGHYYSIKTAKEALEKSKELQKNESIWIISNNTLRHILKETTEK